MLYGGPLGTYLSGYCAPGSAKSGSPNFTSSASGPSSSSTLTRPRGSRFRTPSAYGATGSGTNSPASLSTSSSSRSNFYTPQTRRKYSDDGTEPQSSSRSRYTTSGTPVNNTNSSSVNSTSATTSGYYFRPSPSYTSSASTTVSSPAVTNTVTVAPSSIGCAAESELDYKRLYEAERQATEELRTQLDRKQQELRDLRAQIDETRRLPSLQKQQGLQRRHSNDTDQRTLEELRAESEKLKAQHRALTRVITRLM